MRPAAHVSKPIKGTSWASRPALLFLDVLLINCDRCNEGHVDALTLPQHHLVAHMLSEVSGCVLLRSTNSK